MILIERLGGYEKAKSTLTSAGHEHDEMLLQYRRQNNIFDVNDLVIIPSRGNGIFRVSGLLGRGDIQEMRHATPEEIKTGRRLEINTIDSFIEDGGFDKAFMDVFGLPESVKQSLKEVS